MMIARRQFHSWSEARSRRLAAHSGLDSLIQRVGRGGWRNHKRSADQKQRRHEAPPSATRRLCSSLHRIQPSRSQDKVASDWRAGRRSGSFSGRHRCGGSDLWRGCPTGLCRQACVTGTSSSVDGRRVAGAPAGKGMQPAGTEIAPRRRTNCRRPRWPPRPSEAIATFRRAGGRGCRRLGKRRAGSFSRSWPKMRSSSSARRPRSSHWLRLVETLLVPTLRAATCRETRPRANSAYSNARDYTDRSGRLRLALRPARATCFGRPHHIADGREVR